MSIDFQCNKHHFQDWLLYRKSWVWIELHSSVVEVYNVLNNKVVHWLVCYHTLYFTHIGIQCSSDPTYCKTTLTLTLMSSISKIMFVTSLKTSLDNTLIFLVKCLITSNSLSDLWKKLLSAVRKKSQIKWRSD